MFALDLKGIKFYLPKTKKKENLANALVMTKQAAGCLESWMHDSHHDSLKQKWVRYMHQRMRQMKRQRKPFFDLLQRVTDEISRHDMMMMGDWNAWIGAMQEGEDGVVGWHGLGDERSEDDVRFVSFCAANNLAIVSTMFPYKNIHKYTWAAPNGRVTNQIDHVAVNSKFKRSVRDTRWIEAQRVEAITTYLLQLCVFVCAG